MTKLKRYLSILLLFSFLIILSSCTRLSNDHSKIEKYIRNRYSDDKLTYDSEGVLNWYTGSDEFNMYSENLGETFKVYATDWKTDSPKIEDNYISKKYSKQVEEIFLNLLDDCLDEFKIGRIDSNDILINSNVDSNMSFDSWWNEYGKSKIIRIVAKSKNVELDFNDSLYNYDDLVSEVYQVNKVFEKLKENNLIDTKVHITWVDDVSYSLSYSKILGNLSNSEGYKKYYPIAYLALEDSEDYNTYKITWYNINENSEEIDNLLNESNMDDKFNDMLENDFGNDSNLEENNNLNGNKVFDENNRVVMPDPDELQKGLEEGKKVIYGN